MNLWQNITDKGSYRQDIPFKRLTRVNLSHFWKSQEGGINQIVKEKGFALTTGN